MVNCLDPDQIFEIYIAEKLYFWLKMLARAEIFYIIRASR